jgi:hypothetical protein
MCCLRMLHTITLLSKDFLRLSHSLVTQEMGLMLAQGVNSLIYTS